MYILLMRIGLGLFGSNVDQINLHKLWKGTLIVIGLIFILIQKMIIWNWSLAFDEIFWDGGAFIHVPM